jgi:hypothetical protein
MELKITAFSLAFISSFPLEDVPICAHNNYAICSGNSVPTFRDNVSFPSSRVKKSKQKAFFLAFLTTENGNDTLSRDVGKGLPSDAA